MHIDKFQREMVARYGLEGADYIVKSACEKLANSLPPAVEEESAVAMADSTPGQIRAARKDGKVPPTQKHKGVDTPPVAQGGTDKMASVQRLFDLLPWNRQ